MTGKMVSIPGGKYIAGDNRFYPEELPPHEVHVKPFEIDRYPVTNRQFRDFVESTGYVTLAERPVDLGQGSDTTSKDFAPGSLVFTATSGPVDLQDWTQWWRWVEGAHWRKPWGSIEGIDDRMDHPVVHVAYEDALSFAQWAKKRLPTEAEWEYVARDGLTQATYAWGEEENLNARFANTWQGRFPYQNSGAQGWVGTSPVGSFPENGFSVSDLIGNVWEWTSSLWDAPAEKPEEQVGCCAKVAFGDTLSHGDRNPRRVLKGGSHLCSPDYCWRYRPAARSPQAEDTSTTHVGFRCAR